MAWTINAIEKLRVGTAKGACCVAVGITRRHRKRNNWVITHKGYSSSQKMRMNDHNKCFTKYNCK